MIELRRLRLSEIDLAADLHRRAGALIPGYATFARPLSAFQTLYAEHVMKDGPVWGAFDAQRLVGHVALLPGWLDHLYVDPDRQSLGIGSRLVALAQRKQSELRLYTFRSNVRARALYERHGIVIEELTDGDRNEEREPDCTYVWRRS